MPNPLDELNVQLPGRLTTVEILLTLLLREKSGARKLFVEADAILAAYESAVTADGLGADDAYALKLFEAARQSLDAIRTRALAR